MKNVRYLSQEEFDKLAPEIIRDLNLITRFYFECIEANETGIVKKPSPKQIVKFLKNHRKHES